jgi:ribosome recycling factor
MSYEDLITEAKGKLEKAHAALEHDFRRLRTGRANSAIVEHVQVEAYGSRMPITQVAAITIPEPTQIMIKPWDKSMLKEIEKAIVGSDLGLAPQNDGICIRLQLPPMSSERRKQLAGEAKEFGEKHKVVMRNTRRDAIKHIEARGKEQKLPEDATKKASEKISELLKQFETALDAAVKAKQEEILSF